jgi:hypothetical protein
MAKHRIKSEVVRFIAGLPSLQRGNRFVSPSYAWLWQASKQERSQLRCVTSDMCTWRRARPVAAAMNGRRSARLLVPNPLE